MPGTRRVITAAALVLAGAGCAAGDGTATALPTRPAGAAPPATSAAPTTAAAGPSADTGHTDPVAVYTGWWTALEGAYAAADPADPALAEYAVDPILSRQRASIAALRAQGVVQRTRFALAPRVRYRTDRTAEIEDCVRGPANTYYDAVTGRPRAPRGYRNDAPTEDRLVTTLQRRGDRWYVVAATGRGELGC